MLKINTIKLNHKKHPFIGYEYQYDPIVNSLLMTIAYQLTTYIGDSDLYKTCLNSAPYVYHINASIMERVDNYIIFGSDFGSLQEYISSDKFTNLMTQWEQAFAAQPAEILLTIDEEQNFTITYQHSASMSSRNHNVLHKSQVSITTTKHIEKQNPWFISMNGKFAEIEHEDGAYYPNSENEKLLMFAELLINLSHTIFLKNETISFQYCDHRYSLRVIKDKIYIYDYIMNIKALPPMQSFLDLVRQWQLSVNQKPDLIKLFIDDEYNFKIIILK